jgi:hypothetical protein
MKTAGVHPFLNDVAVNFVLRLRLRHHEWAAIAQHASGLLRPSF